MSQGYDHLFQYPAYIQGQIDSLRSLILALAQEIPKDRFRAMSLYRLDALRTALLSQPVSETRLIAVDHFEEWVRKVSS
ncbi:hypothetical protein [Thermomonas sp.]|uniref:hypothetical protein n=1 Tax=Thermomonas sp. TaxID=1971895 RepID=UPI00391D8872